MLGQFGEEQATSAKNKKKNGGNLLVVGQAGEEQVISTKNKYVWAGTSC